MNYLKSAFEKRALQPGQTPRAFFERVRGPYSCLLESALGGRYSYIGYDPYAVVWSRAGVTEVQHLRDFFDWKKSGTTKMMEGKPLEVLRDLMHHFELKGKMPVPFSGGFCGYFSYDFGASLMGVRQQVFDDTGLPDFVFLMVDKVVVFDHETGEIYFLALDETDLKAKRKVAEMKADFEQSAALVSAGEMGKLQSNLTLAQYEEKIAQIKEFLIAGDTYQVNFSQRFSGECSMDGWKLYKRLMETNPAPYSCYFRFPEFQIISSSPELLLCKRGKTLETRPIKGTVARGANEEEDQALIEELLASKKDEAELAMIVDLERNDLGKVSEIGSVKVKDHRAVEKFARVIHTVSTVEGRIAFQKDIFDVIEAVFPGGSITGCPKKRTMEIIDRLEDFRRGIYCGSAGFMSFSGDADFNILIRTMLLKERNLYFHSGGGIVMDSEPKKEFLETLDKAAGLKAALAGF